ncbi:MAG: hypothetical protein LQ342_005315 [Letrouitia transgressa]|nr:MAG: hypothetical protein LQ342_005315 [Letrouitia transgressa]
MANAMYREEPPQSQIHLRSFLVNKLPVFLNNYSSMIFPPLNMEYCISQALLRVDPAAFPSFSQMFDILDKNSMLSEARQEFLFACALHQLIPEQSIEGLLGDVPMQSLPASGRYVKNNLVSLCTANPAKIDDMIGELENFEGNAGEIVGALIEIMSTLCSNNDTMTLRGICNSLVRRAAVCDTVMLFTSAQTLLQPLCQLLDNWQEQEDQGESQPMYDEFGSILLFVSTVFHHFDIDYKELGVEGPNSFCIKYFQESSESRHVNLLTERESDQLGGWIRGLFETEGISDEVMSMCKPKEFHLLVATLFDQSLKACQAKILSLETLKGGLEYLLEPFLLPSLVAGLTFVTHKLWETKESSASIDTLIPALETLLRPPSSSTSDSSAIHAAVLSIVARPLDDALMHAQRQHRSQTDIAPLLDILKPHTQRQQRKSAAYQELKTWTATPGGGLLAALNSTIQSLLLWSTSTEMPPPNYTHRMLLEAVHVLGAKAVLKLLVDEIVTQFSSAATDETGANAQQDGEMLMDVVTSLIVAPTGSVGSPLLPTRNLPIQHSRRQHGLSLRNALQTEFAGAYELSKSNLARAEAVVRLHRRAEYFVGVGGSGVRGGVGDGLNGGAGVAGGGQDLAAGLGVDVSGANGAMGVDVDADGSMLLDQTQGAPDIDDVLKDAGRRISTAAGAAGAGGFMEAEDAFLGIG